ncbi:MAG TPA: hypothetical protein HA360_06100 [Nanoarchaeota archaeon]|nr:hypothetical protein [Candidatus Woesearchaeota archaeon]HIH15574.1 hypothetical protein [Nanoarchaeota archaeon]HIH59095.1 hypothetical protein [Nanoarchaeota archaeon]HII14617.1 hypothetical protein [Nanoarchaeota archaeon]HIJ05440.1 hypothetical protein [Nanoarchaeota archaeon]
MGEKYKIWIVTLIILLSIIYSFTFATANNYSAELSFITAHTVYQLGERIELKGSLFLSNYSTNGSLVTNHSAVTSTSLNLSVMNKTNNAHIISYIINTTSDGSFYSKSDFYPSAVLISAPSSTGTYYLRLNYTDPSNGTWWAQNEILVTSTAVDILEVKTDKVSYKQSEAMTIFSEAIRDVGGNRAYLANVTINGSIQNSSKYILENFSCITGATGKCTLTTTAPSTLGSYYIEANNYKAFTNFKVESFKATILMKDKLGKSIRNVFSSGEDASIEITIPSLTTSNDVYTFVGTVRDSSGNIKENVSSTSLIQNNSFTNRYTWTLRATSFSEGRYNVLINITDASSHLIQARTSFEVRDWSLLLKKADTNSNFIYEYSAFPNETVNLELYPTYRTNGSIISTINATSAINITLFDTFNNIRAKANATWNVSCSTKGCYQFAVKLPNLTGEYSLLTRVAFDTDDQSQKKIIHILNKTLSAQATNIEGSLKDLFNTNEYVYLSLSAKNQTSAINLTNASIIRITFSNGSELSYAEVGNYDLVNISNNISEWAWNVTTQRLKLDPPRSGGLYSASINGDNNTAATIARFTINPYDICVSTKDTAGSVSSGYYYSYQFKTSDTIYFELKMFQAENALGRASFENATNTSYGLGASCTDYSATKQVVNNATISIEEVKNMNSGKSFAFNVTSSACQSDSTSGAYTCTVAPNGTWDGGPYGVKFKILGEDGTTSDIAYGNFEARAFYIYAYSSSWANKPTSNISLTIDMYEAGSNWWANVGSAGSKGTITLEKLEYMGRQGEWIWPPIDYDYNTTRINSTSITSGRGTMNLIYNATKNNEWATGTYRAVLKGVDDEGNSDYGYGYFDIRQWEVYGSPVDCTGTVCTSTYNLNSKENVTMYVTIMNAGEWGTSGTSLGGNVTIKVKKISDCRKWPCTDLNASSYNSTSIIVNQSNGWYWGTTNLNKNYTIAINTTTGSWGTGYWQVVLDVNGTQTGTAWFNTIAFYTEAMPSDYSGANYKTSIKNSEAQYFRVKTLKSQKNGGYYYTGYNLSDYINTTIDDLTLNSWDQATYKTRQLNYPEDLNVTIVVDGLSSNATVLNGTGVINITYVNGSNWQSGYYNGEIILRDTKNQTANAWLWFQVQPFRVSITMNSTSVDNDGCIGGTLYVYEPNYYSGTLLNGNYNISSVREDTWSGSTYTTMTYTNFTSANFSNQTGISLCPNSGTWGAGSWGNYHYLKVTVQDSSGNKEQGWVYFRTVPFSVSWGSISGGSTVLKTSPITVPINFSKATDGSTATGNITSIYQWSWDSYQSTKNTFVFNIGQCWSNVSSSCNVTGTKNVVIYPPSSGWKEGYNYLQGTFISSTGVAVDDQTSLGFNSQNTYNGYWSNYNSSGQWQYYFAPNDNVSLRLYVRDQNQNSISVNVTKVEYTLSDSSCWSEYCKGYTTATYVIGSGTNTNASDSASITIVKGTSNWSKGGMTIRATVQAVNGTGGTSVISGGYAYIKDLSPPTVNLTAPTTRQNFTTSALALNWTTVENAKCYVTLLNFQNLKDWYCAQSSYYSINTTADYCSTTLFNGTSYYYEYISTDYRSYSNGSNWNWGSQTTGLTTGGTTHNYQFNISSLKAQDYGMQVNCYDEDWNAAYGWAAVHVNLSA